MRLLLGVLILLLLLVVRSQLRHPELLARRVQEQTAMLSELAHKDMVTGVANRRWFYQQLSELLCRQQTGNGGALYLIDVDDFKSINDTKGHHYGDQFLKVLADRMQQHVSRGDMLARIGGDEFALLELGIKVALDDFGTGYSSFSMLRTLPVDYLKIDRSFIQRLPGKSTDGNIVNSIVGMAHTLDIKVVAEGVETLEQLSVLREYRCDFVQGYLLARPSMPEYFDVSLVWAPPSPDLC